MAGCTEHANVANNKLQCPASRQTKGCCVPIAELQFVERTLTISEPAPKIELFICY